MRRRRIDVTRTSCQRARSSAVRLQFRGPARTSHGARFRAASPVSGSRASMRTETTRSGAVRASSHVALVVAREIELFATRRGRVGASDVEEIEAVAEHIAELVASTRPKVGLVDARGLAEELGVARDWVYANAERLGGVRLGDGPRARLRFDVERAREALAASRQDTQPTNGGAPKRRRGRPRGKVVPTGVPLIQGRSSR